MPRGLLRIIPDVTLLGRSNSTEEVSMSDVSNALVVDLRDALSRRRYNPVVVHNYCRNAEHFLDYLEQQKIGLEAVAPNDVSTYLRLAVRRFRKRHGHSPAPGWTSIPRSGIHALLRFALERWPPEPLAASDDERLCREVCDQYGRWLRTERGLAAASIRVLMWEARHFCAWRIQRCGAADFAGLTVRDVDAYMDLRTPALTRKSLKDVAERLRSFLRHLHRTGRVAIDLSPHVIAPLLYAYEGIPSVLSPEQIASVLDTTGNDASPMGLRDHAILQLLANYGLRAGEVAHLKLDDIDWRAETLRVHRSKIGAQSLLPLLEPAGEAVLHYLRHGRPETDTRDVFIRMRAPYLRMSGAAIYSAVSRRLAAAGVTPIGKRGPHIFRHARAVSLLRASVPRKVIGDVLGHRSPDSTVPYLKLATEDLRAIALEIPGREVRS